MFFSGFGFFFFIFVVVWFFVGVFMLVVDVLRVDVTFWF